jgi:Cu+-exporting ATPase
MKHCCHGKEQGSARVAAAGAEYTCPMHPEIRQIGPGDCPICGMALEPAGVPTADADESELRDLTRRLIVAAALTLPVFLLAMSHLVHGSALSHWSATPTGRWVQALAATPVLFWCGWPFLRRAWTSLQHRSANMFTLIATGTLAAWILSIVALLAPRAVGTTDLYFEAAAVIITLVLAGQVLELRARRKTGDALRALMDLAPATAWQLASDGAISEVPLTDIARGDLLRVKPGGKVPVDGIVETGIGTIDESMLTGESTPVEIQPGLRVRAGTLNGSGSFDLRAEGVGSSTLLAQIIAMVSEAQRARAPVQDLADRVAVVFVPIVFAVAAISFMAWLAFGGSLAQAVTAAVSVLIIACPCAIGLAVPMSIMVGVGRAARSGILVRQPAALERLEKIDTLCLDKTGTLTNGRPEVVRIVCAPTIEEARLLALAAGLEEHSEHPLGASILRHAAKVKIVAAKAENFSATAGGGVSGRIDGHTVRIGTPEFAGTSGSNPGDEEGCSRLDVSIDGNWAGTFFVADTIKPSAIDALGALRHMGVRPVMLTGDRAGAARRVAEELGIGDYRAGLLPGDKARLIGELQHEGKRVCMAGDGVNDAPALAAADTGIAMGPGSDVAKETADFVLVHGSLDGIVRTFTLGCAIMRNIRENLFLAFVYNALGIPLAAGALYPLTGWLLSPMIAGAAMSLSSVSVIANALRLAGRRGNS